MMLVVGHMLLCRERRESERGRKIGRKGDRCERKRKGEREREV